MSDCKKCGGPIDSWVDATRKNGSTYKKPMDADGQCHWDTCSAKIQGGGGGVSSTGEVLKQMQMQTDLLSKVVELLQRMTPNDTIKTEPKRQTPGYGAHPHDTDPDELSEKSAIQEECPF